MICMVNQPYWTMEEDMLAVLDKMFFFIAGRYQKFNIATHERININIDFILQ